MDKIKLYDLDIEKYILGCAIISKTFLKRIVDNINEECFSIDAHKKLYKMIKTLYLNNEIVNVDVIIEELGSIKLFDDIENIDYLNELVNTCIVKSNIDDSIKTVYEKSILRKIIGNIKNGSIAINDIILNVEEKIEYQYKNKGPLQFATGFYDLDKALINLNNYHLFVFAGRSGMGKTTLVSNIALFNSQQKNSNVLFFSLETTKDEIVKKMISSIGQVDSNKIDLGKLEQNDWKRLNEVMEKLKESNLIINDKFDITIDEIIKIAKLQYEINSISLIIIDSLDYFMLNDVNNKRMEFDEYLKKLKNLSREINVPIILTVNLPSDIDNRKDKRPKLKDLNKICSVDDYADVIMFLYRDDYYYEEAKMDNNCSIVECTIAKNKNGITKKFELLLKKNTHTFINILKEEEE